MYINRNSEWGYGYRRKRKIWSILGWAFLVIWILLQMFTSYYLCYLLWITSNIVIGAIVGSMALFKRTLNISEPFYTLKNITVRLVGMAILSGGIFFLNVMEIQNFYRDIPHYLLGNYEVIRGEADISTGSYRGYVSQSITIQGETFDNKQVLKESLYDGRFLELRYLPNSKYILEIWY